jgi:hypothetical protein
MSAIMSVMLRLAALAAVSGGVALAGAGAAWAEDAPNSWNARWESWVELGGYAANRPEARRGEAALWMPLAQNGRSLVFGDFRGKLFGEDQREGNAALGYRYMSASGWNPGFWVGFDRRRSELGTDFDQISFGGELLSADWDLHINGYVPLNDSVPVSGGGAGTGVEIIGNQLFLVDRGALYELAFWGLDAEIGFRVPLERLGLDGRGQEVGRYLDLRLFAGGCYFDHNDFDGEVFGPKVRAEWRIENIFEDWEGSRLTFEAAYQYDDVREEQYEAGLRLRIPLGGSGGRSGKVDGYRAPLSRQEKRMAEGLKRNTDIVSVSQIRTTGSAPEPVEDALSGVALNTVVFVANDEDLRPVTSANENEYTLIVYDGTGGAQSSAILLPQNRTLLGGGGTLQVRGQTSGRLANYTAPGTIPAIMQAGTSQVSIQYNAHISDFMILGGTVGVSVNTTNAHVFLSNLEIENSTSSAISATRNNINIIARSITMNNVHSGILLNGIGVALDIRGSTMSNVEDTGIGIVDGSANVTVANTAFSGQFDTAAFYFGIVTGTYSDSTGNTYSSPKTDKCMLFGGGTFNGSIGFSDASTITASDCVGP